MFTGLIEEVGLIASVKPIAGGKKIRVIAKKIMEDVKIDDSVAVNGVCLTATKIEFDGFWADAVGATLNKTTLHEIKSNCSVNLERALKLSDRLGGHLVQGHVNAIGTILEISKLGENYYLAISYPSQIAKYLISEGSVTIDGISLTIADLDSSKFGLSVIPHTWKTTNLQQKKVGDKVNIETDVIAKYVEKLLIFKDKEINKNTSDGLSEDYLTKMGF